MSTFNSKSLFQKVAQSDVMKIIVAISLCYVIVHFIQVAVVIGGEPESIFIQSLWNKIALPTNIKSFWRQPWSIITFMFNDMSIMRILGNMIWLWLFGTVLEDLLGKNKVLPIFITGGLFTALCFWAFGALTSLTETHFAGCTPSVIAVAVAAIIFKPKYEFFMIMIIIIL